MTSPLRVDPELLQATAGVMSDVATDVAGLALGYELAGAASGLPGLATADALQAAGYDIDQACRQVGSEFEGLSAKLHAAAAHFTNTDDESADGIRGIADGMAT